MIHYSIYDSICHSSSEEYSQTIALMFLEIVASWLTSQPHIIMQIWYRFSGTGIWRKLLYCMYTVCLSLSHSLFVYVLYKTYIMYICFWKKSYAL